MPHVELSCYPGRTEEQKKLCAEKIAQAITETMGCDLSSVSIAIKEVQKEDWKEQIWEPRIVADEKDLYKKPGYTCD